MAVGDIRVHACKGAPTHGGTAINSARSFAIAKSSVKSSDPGPAGNPGIADEIVTKRDLMVTVTALDPDELHDFVEATAGNFVGKYVGESGANKQVTIKNVYFTNPPSETVVEDDSGAPAQAFQITGRAQWGASDTWPLMEVHASAS